MNVDNFLRNQIKLILNEQEDGEKSGTKGKPKIKSVGVGRGGWKGKIKEAGALASKNPSKLMSNLKMNGPDRKSDDLKKLQQILEQAASGTDEMSGVFSYLDNQPKARDSKGNLLKSVALSVKTISPRDAQKYIEHTIVGATAAFGIKWDNSVEITKSGNNIVVYLK